MSGAVEANSGFGLEPSPASSPCLPAYGLAFQNSRTAEAHNLQLMQIQLHACTQPKMEKESKKQVK